MAKPPKPTPEVAEKIYAAWVYENQTGKALLVYCPDERAKLLADGYSDCPTKAKTAPSKAELAKIKAAEEAKAKQVKSDARELEGYRSNQKRKN